MHAAPSGGHNLELQPPHLLRPQERAKKPTEKLNVSREERPNSRIQLDKCDLS